MSRIPEIFRICATFKSELPRTITLDDVIERAVELDEAEDGALLPFPAQPRSSEPAPARGKKRA